jgi:cell division septation protein DedD
VTRFARCFIVVATVLCTTLLAGCISSEGTGSGGGKSTEGPEKSVGPIDTSKSVAPAAASAKTKSVASRDKRPERKTAKLTAKQDTVKASLVKKSKSPARPLPKIERPANPAFTVQIGAFIQPNNALRNQKTAKSRFPKYPVYSNFDSRSKFYRVSVGKFMTRSEALALRREILKRFSKEYPSCWVNYIAK